MQYSQFRSNMTSLVNDLVTRMDEVNDNPSLTEDVKVQKFLAIGEDLGIPVDGVTPS